MITKNIGTLKIAAWYAQSWLCVPGVDELDSLRTSTAQTMLHGRLTAATVYWAL